MNEQEHRSMTIGDNASLQSRLWYVVTRRCRDMRMGMASVDAESLEKVLEADEGKKRNWQRLQNDILEDVAKELGIEPYDFQSGNG